MQEETVAIVNNVGLHARPAALLVKTASGFAANVEIIKNGKSANAKSILSVMSAGIKQGEAVTVRTNGADEQAALAAIVALIASGFGEK